MTTFQKTVKYIATGFAAFLVISIVVTILQVGLIVFDFAGGNGRGTIDSNEKFEASTSIKKILVNSSIGKIAIYEGEEDEIRVEANNVSKNYSCKLNGNDTIMIKNKKSRKFFIGINKNSSIKIYIPKGFELTLVDMDLGIGEIDIENANIEKLSVESGVGDIHIIDSKINRSEFDLGIADFKLKNSIVGDLKVDSGIGDIKLDIIGNIEEYEIEIDNGIGDNEINDKNSKKYNGEIAKYEIELDNGIGDVKINMEK